VPNFKLISSAASGKPVTQSALASSKRRNKSRNEWINGENRARRRRSRDIAWKSSLSRIGTCRSCSWRKKEYSLRTTGFWKSQEILTTRSGSSRQISTITNTSKRGQNLTVK
jgi:hypothetical protein